MATQAGSKHFSVTLDVPENVCWFTDPGALRTILVNLLSNAVSHSPVDGSVQLSVECAGERGRLLIANTNHDLCPADLAHLFERFWRKDPARSPTLHCGLGLALSKACAENLGLELRAALNDLFLNRSAPLYGRARKLLHIERAGLATRRWRRIGSSMTMPRPFSRTIADSNIRK